MRGRKLALVSETMRFVLQHLSRRDAVGLVSYGSEVKVLAPLTACDEEGRARLEAALGRLRAFSQTNLSGGLLRGLELHGDDVEAGQASGQAPAADDTRTPQYFIGTPGGEEPLAQSWVGQSWMDLAGAPAGAGRGEPEAGPPVVRATFLFTDGHANVGILRPEAICSAAEAALRELGARRSSISTFGFGSDHSAELLRGLAEAGGGVYCYIENEDQIGEAFGEALGGLLSTTHQNVRLRVELAPGVSLVKAQTALPVEGPAAAAAGGRLLSVELGDLFAEERRDVLLTLGLPGAPAEGPQVLGQVHARGFSVLAGCSEEAKMAEGIVVQRVAGSVGTAAGSPHPLVERHRNRYDATEALGAARRAAHGGDLAAARQRLTVAAAALSASELTRQGDVASVGLLADVQECLADLESEEAYRQRASKKMASMELSHGQQRACGQGFSETYTTSHALTMKTFFQSSVQ